MVDKVYLLRHGRTALNAAGLLRGRLDEPLDEVGRREAAALSGLFACVDLHMIISSPLIRAKDTALTIAAPHGIEVLTVQGFIDRDYGAWSGKVRELLEQRYGSVDRAPAGEVEDKDAFHGRVIAALSATMTSASYGTLLIVAHDAVNRALLRHCCPMLPLDISQPTGCWNLLVVGKTAIECKIVGAVPGDGHVP